MEHSQESTKIELRTKFRAQRAQRPQAEREAFAQQLSVDSQPVLAAAGTVTLFVGVGDEPDTRPLLRALHGRGVRVLLPIVMPDWSLDWAVYVGDDALAEAGYGLLEPTGPRLGAAAVAEADVVLVPALAVDPSGRRLGQGAGFYDRALAFVATDTPVLAIVFDDERISDDLPEEPHDRRVNGILP
ncbi:MAG: 5-formyltetrahydrofolate cyclo-ligase [Acidobacteria bacterium]|nr:5-formyltetrahydrofolate cyclo-ligase [Acidobacteriota bacterium]